MKMLKPVIAAAVGLTFATGSLADTTITFSGGNTLSTIPLRDFGNRYLGSGKPVVVGTFASSFDPLRDLNRYAVDSALNFVPDYYFRMVGNGDFKPLSQVETTGMGQFSGTAIGNDIVGQRIWMVLWDRSDQFFANSIIVTSLLHDNWIAGANGDAQKIDIAEADRAIFGYIWNGQVVFSILPVPEPNSAVLVGIGGIFLILATLRSAAKA